MNDITIYVAFVAGMLTFFSPCIFPLIPVYLMQITGVNFKDKNVTISKSLLIKKSILFISGFTVVFILLGLFSGLIGQYVSAYKFLVEKIAGFIIIVIALNMLGFLKINLFKLNLFKSKKKASNVPLSSFAMGVVFGSTWTPCVSFSLSAILLLVGMKGSMVEGILMLFIYSIGLALPFLIMSFVLIKTDFLFNKMKKHLNIIHLIQAWFMFVLGLLLFTGQFQKISGWISSFNIISF